ncbi:MAG: ferredoxin--NADP reductase [Pseudomonadota bacterium]|nr:ferredoxin--NADP reductase [Pseudomonadota bacterium]
MSDWVKGRVIGKKQWNHRLFSLQIDAPIHDFKAGQFTKVALDIGNERVGRPYSLVNAPQERPLEIFFNEVPEGPLTPRLSDLVTNDGLWLSARPGGVFTMENVVQRRHLWLLATGTALGVYLSILRTPEPWTQFDRVVLVHGVRTADELAYGEAVASLKERRGERFNFLPLLSRERRGDALYGRITQLLESGVLEARAGLRIHPDDSHLMLCGNSEMIKEVRDLLEARGLRRHRRNEPGHYTTEQYH